MNCGSERAREPANPARDLLGRVRDAVEIVRYRRQVALWKRSGVRFGRGVLVMPSAFLDLTYGWMIAIGDRTRIAREVRIFTHDASAQRDLGHGRVGPVTIGRDCLIAERATILPGVTIGDRVMVGVGSVVATDLPSNSRVMGVPARVYGTFDAWLEEIRQAISTRPCFAHEELHDLTESRRGATLECLRRNGGHGYSRDPFSASPYYVTPP
jgi:acetyltransferase-like isoleucine patch superfamily enzyme